MKNTLSILDNENGTALFISMVILVISTIIGTAAINTSKTEIKISNNDRLHKVAFHAADGGTEAGRELLEENFSCPTGFSLTTIGGLQIEPGTANYAPPTDPTATYNHKQFWRNEFDPPCPFPTNTLRDVRIGASDTVPHTNLAFAGITRLSTGSALQMIAGYEGKAFGAAGGGAHIATGIHSQHVGVASSQAVVRTISIHMIGQEGTCRY